MMARTLVAPNPPKAVRARKPLEFAGLLLLPGEARQYLGLKRDAFYLAKKNDPTFPHTRLVPGIETPCYYRPDLDAWAANLPKSERLMS
jgi:hypothetical protein